MGKPSSDKSVLLGAIRRRIGVTKSTSRRPRIFYGWYMVVAGTGIDLWISIAWFYGNQIFFTPIISTFGWSRAVVSGAFAFQRLEGSILAPVEGFLVDRLGPRKLMLPGVIVAGLGLISLGFVQSVWMFYVSVLVVALGTSLSGVPRQWAIVQWFHRLRGRALGIAATGPVISGPLLIIVVWLVETFGWRQAFVVLGLATWGICLPLVLVFRSRPAQYGYLPDGDSPGDLNEEAVAGDTAQKRKIHRNQQAGPNLTVRQALSTPAFWFLNLIFGAQTMGVSALIVHLVPYFESLGFSRTQAVSALGSFTVLSVIGRIGGGWAMDYLERRAVLAGLLACQAVGFFILANVTSYWQIFPFALLYGIAFGGMIPSRSAISSSYFGTQNFGAIQGLTQSATVVSGMIGPVLMGWVFDLNQSYVLAIYVLMGVAASAIPITFFARAPHIQPKVAEQGVAVR